MQHERQECKASETRVRHECYTNEWDTSEKILILITAQVKHIFTFLYLLFGKWKITKREQFHSNASFPYQNAFEKCTAKIGLCNGIYTLDCICKFRCTFPYSYTEKCSLIFDKNRDHVKIPTYFLAITVQVCFLSDFFTKRIFGRVCGQVIKKTASIFHERGKSLTKDDSKEARITRIFSSTTELVSSLKFFWKGSIGILNTPQSVSKRHSKKCQNGNKQKC